VGARGGRPKDTERSSYDKWSKSRGFALFSLGTAIGVFPPAKGAPKELPVPDISFEERSSFPVLRSFNEVGSEGGLVPPFSEGGCLGRLRVIRGL